MEGRMTNLQLDYDEGIILQSTEAIRYEDKDQNIDELYLTHKNLIYVYSIKKGIFSKPEPVIEKMPLDDIKVIGGSAQVSVLDNDDYGICLQI